MSKGLPLGQLMDVKPAPLAGVRALFDRTLSAKEACQKIFSKKRPAPFVYMPEEVVHTAVFAPAGAGKSTGMVIPFLLSNNESAVVIDIKGELARATAEVRRQRGHRIAIIDPYCKVVLNPDSLNPLDFIDKDADDALDACDDVGAAIGVVDPQEKDKHFGEQGINFISNFTAAIVRHAVGEKRSLQQVIELLSDPKKVDWALERMAISDAWGGLLARRAGQLKHCIDKERASVLSTVSRFTRCLTTPAMQRSTSTSSFDPRDLKHGKMTVYICLPPEHIESQSGWMRLVITTLCRAVVSQGLSEYPLVHFILDEVATLGTLDCLKKIVAQYRGYGVRAQFYYQSAGQLKEQWPKDHGQTLLSNTAKVFFGTSDYDTASMVCNMLGKETIIEESGGSGSSGGGNRGWSQSKEPSSSGGFNWGWSSNKSWKQSPRELYKPEELMTLSPRIAITFPGGGIRPIKTYLVRYYEWPGQSGLDGAWAAARTFIQSLALLWAAALLFFLLVQKMSQMRVYPVYQAPVFQFSRERKENRANAKRNRPAAFRPGDARTVDGRQRN